MYTEYPRTGHSPSVGDSSFANLKACLVGGVLAEEARQARQAGEGLGEAADVGAQRVASLSPAVL